MPSSWGLSFLKTGVAEEPAPAPAPAPVAAEQEDSRLPAESPTPTPRPASPSLASPAAAPGPTDRQEWQTLLLEYEALLRRFENIIAEKQQQTTTTPTTTLVGNGDVPQVKSAPVSVPPTSPRLVTYARLLVLFALWVLLDSTITSHEQQHTVHVVLVLARLAATGWLLNFADTRAEAAALLRAAWASNLAAWGVYDRWLVAPLPENLGPIPIGSALKGLRLVAVAAAVCYGATLLHHLYIVNVAPLPGSGVLSALVVSVVNLFVRLAHAVLSRVVDSGVAAFGRLGSIVLGSPWLAPVVTPVAALVSEVFAFAASLPALLELPNKLNMASGALWEAGAKAVGEATLGAAALVPELKLQLPTDGVLLPSLSALANLPSARQSLGDWAASAGGVIGAAVQQAQAQAQAQAQQGAASPSPAPFYQALLKVAELAPAPAPVPGPVPAVPAATTFFEWFASGSGSDSPTTRVL